MRSLFLYEKSYLFGGCSRIGYFEGERERWVVGKTFAWLMKPKRGKKNEYPRPPAAVRHFEYSSWTNFIFFTIKV